MPRGFLVKRRQKYADFVIPTVPSMYHPRIHHRYSDDDRSESSSPEQEFLPQRPPLKYLMPLIAAASRQHQHLPPPGRSYLDPNINSPNLASAADIFNFSATATRQQVLHSDHYDDDDDDQVPLALIKKVKRETDPPVTIKVKDTSAYNRNPPYFPLDRLIIKSSNVSKTPTPPKTENVVDEKMEVSAKKSANIMHFKKRVAAECMEKEAKTESPPSSKKLKAVRKLNFDEDNSSPVSGTIIRNADNLDNDELSGSIIKRGDIDASLNLVEITEEAKAEIAKIENKIGDYVCRLCKEQFEDPFGLAQHRCSCIIHIEYRCPECDKVFNCPANLASHRRWHKPRPTSAKSEKKTTESHARSSPAPSSDGSQTGSDQTSNVSTEGPQYKCEFCDKKFRRLAYLRKHTQIHVRKNELPKEQEELQQKQEEEEEQNTKQQQQQQQQIKATSVFPTSTVYKPELTFKSSADTIVEYRCRFCLSIFYSCAGLTRHVNNKHHPSDPSAIVFMNSKEK